MLAGTAGCGRSSPPDTAPVLAAFEVITNTNRFLVDLAVQQTRQGDYAGAVRSLNELERLYRLTPQQEIVVHHLRRQLEKRLPAAPGSPADSEGASAPR